MKRTWWSIVVVAVAFSFAASGSGTEEIYYGPLEKEFAAMEREVPGFAGWYLERDGSATVRVKETAREADAIARVAAILRKRDENTGQPARRIAARPARFSFSELARFREAMARRLPTGVYRIDADEVANAVSFGVADAGVMAEMQALARELRIPAAAIRLEIMPAPRPLNTLWSRTRPVRGGNGFTAGGDCTVGMNGYWRPSGGTGTYGFITNSHCTATPYAYDGGPAWQGGDVVAWELVDPPAGNYSYCGWSTGASQTPCRWSDSAFYAYGTPASGDPPHESGANSILPTVHYGDWCQSAPVHNRLDVDSSYVLPVTSQFQNTPVNEPLDKIGAMTGWTWGWMTASCVHIVTDGVWKICQDETNIYSGGGDSGAPIFRWYSNDNVAWVGLLHSGIGEEGCERTWHSPVWAIESDLPYFVRE